jgi:predicted RNA binding protein YcfA (HicA-like mRNA interferase family)
MFPSLKSGRLLAVLMRKPLSYAIARQGGSHRTLVSSTGYPQLLFSFHDGVTIPPAAVKKILTKDIGLSEQAALKLL